VTDESPWPLAGGPWSTWRGSLALEERREAWTGKFLAEISTRPDVVAMCELESEPTTLRVAVQDEVHGSTLQKFYGAWLAVKVCARRLPTDPIGTGLDVLESLEVSLDELRDEASRMRPIANERAPDGGRWHPWAVTHPESGMDESEAIRRDVEGGRATAIVERIDQGIIDFPQRLRRAKWTVQAAHFLPLAAMAAVIAIAENVFSIHRWWIALIVGVGVFVIVDRIVIVRVVEPMIEARQRRILDRAAKDIGELGLAALAAGLSRKRVPLIKHPESLYTDEK
jgi:hypothetical protein